MENTPLKHRPKIIIVDDDKLVIQAIFDVLEDTCDVTTSQEPIEVLKKINSEDFDILISDYKMPKLSGISLIKGAIQIKPDILAIVVTGYANKEIALEALKNGAYDIIEKPIIPEILIASINRAWDKIKILKDNKMLVEEIKKYNEQLEEKNLSLAFKNKELKVTYKSLENNNIKLELQYQELKKAQSEVHRSAMKAGMTEVATNILHNVGNILNSVNASTNLLNESFFNSKLEILFNVLGLLKENQKNLTDYLSNDSKGKLIPALLDELKEALADENKKNQSELNRLATKIEHIKTIITFQQNYATQPLKKEEFTINSLIEDALTMLGAEFSNTPISISYEKNNQTKLFLTKHKFLHMLINLIRNAKDSLLESPTNNKEIKILISQNPMKLTIEDNGVGIAKENFHKIFDHGFTTKKHGHGFGLHSCAQTAKDLDCKISAESDGPGLGARFIITFPE